MSENVIKFTETEMQQLAQLQGKYQQKIFELGQNELAKVDLTQQLQDVEEARKKIFEGWGEIQKEEQQILQDLSQKYGDGTLNIKDGTFKPAAK